MNENLKMIKALKILTNKKLGVLIVRDKNKKLVELLPMDKLGDLVKKIQNSIYCL